MYNTVIFDLDGTLLDTLADLTAAVNHTMAQFGYPTHTQEAVRRFVGNGIRNLIERAVPGRLEPAQFQEVYAAFRTYYTAHCQVETKAYDGVLPLLRALHSRGVSMAIVSNKNDAAVKELAKLYFDGLIDTAIGGQEGMRLKPAPDSVNRAMAELGADRNHTLYVGDSEVDQATADNASLACVLVDWGFRARAELEPLGAKAVISAPGALLRVLED
ncbi:MAG: HAD-IA family hydrolase [Oscillospiraceae bacterium]|nr:HAD-IA family hydrolase [Oscillospiraceae bacterium]